MLVGVAPTPDEAKIGPTYFPPRKAQEQPNLIIGNDDQLFPLLQY
jgi:hypothetical protein